MLKDEIQTIVTMYQRDNNKDMFLERLMITGSQPRQINQHLPKQYRKAFTRHYNECIYLANTLGKGIFC